jgi:hypothetical protein
MKLRSAVVRKKLNEKEEPEETPLTSAAKEDRLLVANLKDNSSSETFNCLSPALAGLFLFPCPLKGRLGPVILSNLPLVLQKNVEGSKVFE